MLWPPGPPDHGPRWEPLDVIDETSENWMFPDDDGITATEDTPVEPSADDSWSAQLDPGLLMGFLSEFRSATMETATAARDGAKAGSAVAVRRDPVTSRLEAVEPEPWETDPYAGSDRQVTPEWWFALDGRWYPPELHPDRQVMTTEQPKVEPTQEIFRPIVETPVSIEPTTVSIEPDGKDRAARRRLFAKRRREVGGFALET